MEEEGTFVRPDNLKTATKPMYKLYFKGMVRDERTMILAGFGVAICGDKDDLLFDMKRPIHNSDITLLEAELIALKCGLNEALSLGIKHISICCDHDQIFELVMEKSSKPLAENIVLLMRDVQGIRKRLTFSFPILVTRNHQVDFAYKLAMEAISNEIIIDITTLKKTCNICLEDNLNDDQMFSLDKCGHESCSECVQRHIEVKLLQGSLITCLQYPCESMLTYESCVNILKPKLKEMWEQRIKEDSIPVANQVYCQNPSCAALVSKTELSISIPGPRRLCVKCGEPFCINCKSPWHNNMSCEVYKKLHPNLITNDRMLIHLANRNLWQQCRKCHHMIEHSYGCDSVRCRCGHEFCYQCGADAGICLHTLPIEWPMLIPLPSCFSCCCFVSFLVIIAICVVMPILIVKHK